MNSCYFKSQKSFTAEKIKQNTHLDNIMLTVVEVFKNREYWLKINLTFVKKTKKNAKILVGRRVVIFLPGSVTASCIMCISTGLSCLSFRAKRENPCFAQRENFF